MMLTFLFQRGDTVFLNEHLVINAMGLPWFLFALFHGKLLVWVLDLLEKKARTIKRISENINGGVRLFAECTLFVTGIGIAKNEILPFAIDVVLQLPLYMRIGKFVYREEKNLLKTSSFIVLSIVWLSLNGYIIYNNNTHIGMGNYYVEPLCYLTAVVGTIACFGAAKLITQNYETHISKWVCFIGKHSLCLFCVHAVDFYWMQYVPSTVIPNCIIRVGIDLIVAIMFINLSSYIKSWR
jgi:peptidoglycan/LPS O-acetylase OafA/YrhL